MSDAKNKEMKTIGAILRQWISPVKRIVPVVVIIEQLSTRLKSFAQV